MCLQRAIAKQKKNKKRVLCTPEDCRLFQKTLCVFQCGISAAEHPCEFSEASGIIESIDPGAGFSAVGGFGNEEMFLRQPHHLRKVGDTDDLFAIAEFCDFCTHLHCRFSADIGVDLIKNKHGYFVGFR